VAVGDGWRGAGFLGAVLAPGTHAGRYAPRISVHFWDHTE
jgi:hypothetical protein